MAVTGVGRTVARLVALGPQEEGAYFCGRDDAEVPRRPFVHDHRNPCAVPEVLELPRYGEDIAVPNPANLDHPHRAGSISSYIRDPPLAPPFDGCLRYMTFMLSFPDMSQVIYARVPDGLKEAADLYADKRGTTLTSAVVDLLGRGLAASSDERSVVELEAKLARAEAAKAEADARLAAAINELGGLRGFAQRANLQVGKCPACSQPITGYELMAEGRCRHCSGPLLDLLAPPTNPSLDQREIGLLLGALGVALIAAAIVGGAGR